MKSTIIKPGVTIALISARGGSKGVPKKNIADLGGYPLIAYSIEAARHAPSISRVIVSTDSKEIAEIARRFGAEVPFLRPAEFAADKSPDKDFVFHALKWLAENEGKLPEYIVHLRPTTPLRDPAIVEQAIVTMKEHPKATALRSGYEIKRESPHKYFNKSTDGYWVGLFPHDPRPEYYNLPRQAFPPIYQPDGYVDILKTSHVLASDSFHGDKMLAYVTEDVGEIDTAQDLEKLRSEMLIREPLMRKLLSEHYSI